MEGFMLSALRTLKQKARNPLIYWNYKNGKTVVNTFPDRMYLESTNVCNLDCIMCPTGVKVLNRPKGFMDFDLFKRIMDEMGPHVSATTLHIWGEPLLHPRLIDMIEYATPFGLSVEISTNATILDEETANRLLDSRLSVIYLCLDGHKKETYEAVRRKATYEVTVRNIERFIELKEARGQRSPATFIQIVDMKMTHEEIEDFKRKWTRPGIDMINIKAFDSWGNQLKDVNKLAGKRVRLPKERWQCPMLWYHAHIYWDGTLVCCDRDFQAAHPLGNVKDGVMKAWNGPAMQDLRRRHMEKDLKEIPSCFKCIEWSWWKPSWFNARGNAPEKRDDQQVT